MSMEDDCQRLIKSVAKALSHFLVTPAALLLKHPYKHTLRRQITIEEGFNWYQDCCLAQEFPSQGFPQAKRVQAQNSSESLEGSIGYP